YHEKSVTTQTRGQRGEVQVKNGLWAVFPDRVRWEVEAPDYNDPSVMRRNTMVLAREQFVINSVGKAFPLNGPQLAVQQQQVQYKPLLLLRARRAERFLSRRGQSRETAVEQVMIELPGVPTTLSIDAASGRLLSLSYNRRGPQGTFGEFVQTFSDFRAVD